MAAAAAAQMAFEQQSAAAMQALQHQLLRGTKLFIYNIKHNVLYKVLSLCIIQVYMIADDIDAAVIKITYRVKHFKAIYNKLVKNNQ